MSNVGLHLYSLEVIKVVEGVTRMLFTFLKYL